MRGARLLAAALGLVMAVGGCANLLPGVGEAPRLYTLTPKNTFANDLPVANWQLVIDVPVAAEAIDTRRIAVMAGPTAIDYFADARWTERAPVMVQTLMVESFENTGRIIAVGRQSVTLRADYLLRTDLREFHAMVEPGKAPSVRVRLIAKLVKMPRREIVAFENAEFVATAQSDAMADVVLAFDEALGKCLRRIVEWTLRTGAAGRADPA